MSQRRCTLTLMDRSELLRQLDELLELGPGTLKGAERLDSLDAWGSLVVLGYMAIVNENFGLILSPNQISSCETVDDLLKLTDHRP